MTDPTAHDDAGDDRAWFRSHIDPVVDAQPIADAWSSIAARTDGDSPAPAAVGRHRASTPRWLAAAAVVVVLAAVAAMVVTGRDDHDDSVTTGQTDEATGWYIPKGLPDGWSLIRAGVDRGSYCEDVTHEWRREATDAIGAAAIRLTIEACAVPQPEAVGEPGPSLGSGIDRSTFTTIGDQSQLVWQSDATWTLAGTGVSRDDLVTAARALVADPSLVEVHQTATPLEGFADGGGGSGSGVQPDRGDGIAVFLALRTPQGYRVSYQLFPSGEGWVSSPLQVEEPFDVAAQPNPLVRRDVTSLLGPDLGSSDSGSVFGAWPGADVQIATWVSPGFDQIDDEGEAPPIRYETRRRLIRELAGSLRPATTEEWRAFLATSDEPSSDALRRAESIDDVADAETGATTTAPSAASTTLSAPVTTSSPVEPTTTATPRGEGPVTSGPGTSTPNEQEQASFTELDDLDIRLELESGTVRAGSPVAGTLVLTNPTDRDIDLTECSEGFTRWGLVPAADPDQELMQQAMIDCYATPVVTVPAGETVRYRSSAGDPNGLRWPFLAQRADPGDVFQLNGVAGTLGGGAYLAVLEVPGRTSTLRLSVPVTVPEPPCPTSDAVVKRYMNLTSAKARAQARDDGWAFRIVSGPGSETVLEQNLTCDRINVELNQDGVVSNALRY